VVVAEEEEEEVEKEKEKKIKETKKKNSVLDTLLKAARDSARILYIIL